MLFCGAHEVVSKGKQCNNVSCVNCNVRCLVQEVEKRVDELKSAEHELRREISKRKHEIAMLNDELDSAERHSQLITEQIQTATERTRTLKVCLINTLHFTLLENAAIKMYCHL